MREGKSPFEKYPKLNYWLHLIEIIFPERFRHSGKYSCGISFEYLSGWPEPTKEEITRSCLCHTIFRNFLSCMYHKQQNCLDSYFLWLIFLLRGLFLLLIQSSLFKILLFKEFSLGCIEVGSSLIWKKGKLTKITTRCHSLPLVVIRCLSFSLVVTRCITRLPFYKGSYLGPCQKSMMDLFYKNKLSQ